MSLVHFFTDFGVFGPYMGQMRASLLRENPAVTAIDLMVDAPDRNPRASSYLLAAYSRDVRPGEAVVAVVDPGVGTDRKPIAVNADGRWFVGPDNGLLEMVVRFASVVHLYEISWLPDHLSDSFHGRDLFAPTAAKILTGTVSSITSKPLDDRYSVGWPDDDLSILYLDGYGNAVTGYRGQSLSNKARFLCGERVIEHAKTFGAVKQGEVFWYVNSSGLVEIAENNGRINLTLGLKVGTQLSII